MTVVIQSQEASSLAHANANGDALLSWSFNNGSGTTILVGLVTTGGGGDAVAPSSVTYNGVAMTLVPGATVTYGGGTTCVTIWSLASPATGSQTMQANITYAGTHDLTTLGGAISVTGEGTVSLFGAAASSDAGGASTHAVMASATPTTGSLIFTVGAWGGGSGGAALADSGYTITFQDDDSGATSGDNIIGMIKTSTGAALTPGFSWSGADDWGIVSVEIHPAGASPPGNAVLPAITGSTSQGSVLTASTGTWTGSPTGYAYQWKRNGTNISGATASTYTLVSGDVGDTITVTVTATNANGSTSATSSGVGPITSGAPADTVLPVISGTLGQGSTLSTTNGTWTGSPSSYAYQWKRNGVAISGATASTYVTVSGDVGDTITVTVTATNGGGSTSATSTGVGPITAPAPGNTGAPVIETPLITSSGLFF